MRQQNITSVISIINSNNIQNIRGEINNFRLENGMVHFWIECNKTNLQALRNFHLILDFQSIKKSTGRNGNEIMLLAKCNQISFKKISIDFRHNSFNGTFSLVCKAQADNKNIYCDRERTEEPKKYTDFISMAVKRNANGKKFSQLTPYEKRKMNIIK